MLGRTYDREVCSAARALEVAGERWSLLILRNAAFAGMTRFSELQESLGIAPNILSARLEHFVAEGLMTVSASLEYRLTEKGIAFKPVLIALTQWGDRWAVGAEGPPIAYEHEGCGGPARSVLQCQRCHEEVEPASVAARHTEAMPRAKERRRAIQRRLR